MFTVYDLLILLILGLVLAVVPRILGRREDAGSSATPKFAQTESAYRQLRVELHAGRLTEAEFSSRLSDLMIQDDQGRWWVIGSETGKWNVYGDQEWTQADPPRTRPAASGASTAALWADAFLVGFSIIIFLFLGVAAVNIGDATSLLLGVLGLLCSVIVSLDTLRLTPAGSAARSLGLLAGAFLMGISFMFFIGGLGDVSMDGTTWELLGVLSLLCSVGISVNTQRLLRI